MEVFLTGGIVAICLFLGCAEGLAWVLGKLDPPAEIEEVRVHDAS